MVDEIALLIEQGDLDAALSLLSAVVSRDGLTADYAVLLATIQLRKQMKEQAKQTIFRGLSLDPFHYELYLMLAEIYEKTDPERYFLCLEQALYYAEREVGKEGDDSQYIRGYINQVTQNENRKVAPVSIIIVSYNTKELTTQCVKSIQETCPDSAYELILIDNASTDGSAEWIKEFQVDNPLTKIVINEENKGFPGGCNQGYEKADPENDILYLNSDTIMLPNALFTLRMGLYQETCVGSVGCGANSATNGQKLTDPYISLSDAKRFALKYNLPLETAYEKKPWLMGFAILIRRDVHEKVGLMDERFFPGNYEDDDLGIRIAKSGFQNRFLWNSYIFHYGGRSFGQKPKEKTVELLRNNSIKFQQKWGFDVDYYTETSLAVLHGIKVEKGRILRILHVGCRLGNLMGRIAYQFPGAIVIGIENNKTVAEIVSVSFPVLCMDPEKEDLMLDDRFDYIILSPLYEKRLSEERIKHLLLPGGVILQE